MRKSHKPSTTILPMRTRFAGPLMKSFRSSFARQPRCRAKAQAVKNRLNFSLPTHKKLEQFHAFLLFSKHHIRPDKSSICIHLNPNGSI